VTDVFTNYANNSTRQYDPGLAVITPPNTRTTIHNATDKTWGSRIRATIFDCTDMNMVLISDSATAPAANDENWQPCNTHTGGILSAPLAAGLQTPRVWAKSFTGTVRAASGTANGATITMNTYVTDIPRPKVHWAMDSQATGFTTAGGAVNDALSWSHGTVDGTNPPTAGSAVIEDGFTYDGVNDFMTFHPTSATNPMYDISISAWVELTRGENQHRHIVGNRNNLDSDNNAGMGLRVQNGKLQFYVTAWDQDAGVKRYYSVGINTNLYSTGWHHVVGTYNGQDLVLYMDGAKVGYYPITLYSVPRYELYHDDYSYWTVGAETGNSNVPEPGSFFKDGIDDIRIWHTPLTEQQVYYVFEYGSDFVPTNVSDGNPPIDPGVFIADAQTTTSSPWAYFTMPTCTGGAPSNIEINAVYVNLSTDPAPSEDDLGWQFCTDDPGYIQSQLLDRGTVTLNVYFRDEEGDISTPTPFTMTYEPPDMPHPFAYYDFDARASSTYYYDRAGKKHIRGGDPSYSSIVGGKVGDGYHYDTSSAVGDSDEPIDKTYAFEYNMTKDVSAAVWFMPWENLGNGVIMENGQFHIKRLSSEAIEVKIKAGPEFKRLSFNRLKPNAWNHIGFTRKGNTLKIFFNGKVDKSYVIWNTNLSYNNQELIMHDTTGKSDEYVIYDQALTDDQMAYIYFHGEKGESLDLSPPNLVTAPVPAQYWNFDSASYADPVLSSVKGENMSRRNGVSDGDVDAKVGESFSFSRFEDWIKPNSPTETQNTVGEPQYLESSSTSPVSLGTNFTFVTWVKKPYTTSGFSDDSTALIDQWGPTENDQSFRLGYKRSTNNYYFFDLRMGPGNPNNHRIETTTDSFSSNTNWNHIAVVREGRNVTIYVNGIASGWKDINNLNPVPNLSTTNKLRIGDSNVNTYHLLQGDVSVTPGSPNVTGSGTNFNTSLVTNLTGTVDVTAGTNAVVGTGTLFDSELRSGDKIRISGEYFTVSSITDDTNLTLSGNHVAGAATASMDKIARGVRIALENHDIAAVNSDTSITLDSNHVAGAITEQIYVNRMPAGLNFNNQANDEFRMSGKLDEMAVYNQALSIEQINDLVARGNAGDPLYIEPQITMVGSGLTTDELNPNLSLSDCNGYTHVWVGFDGDATPLDTDAAAGPYPGWVACDTAEGAIASATLTADSVNNLRIWFKTGSTVEPYSTTLTVTHATGDATAPTAPNVTQETGTPTNSSFAKYTLDSCNTSESIAGVYVQHSGAAPDPAASGWQNCSTVNSAFRSPPLNDGVNTISFYFKDSSGNVTANVDRVITHNQPAIPNGNLYFSMNDGDRDGYFVRDGVNRSVASGNNTGNMNVGVAGLIGETIEFLTNSFLEIWDEKFTPTNNFSVSAWVNMSQPATSGSILNKWDNSQTDDSYGLSVDDSGKFCLDLQTVNSSTVWNTSAYKRLCSVGKIDFAEWQHVGVIKNGASVNFYANGESIGSDTIDGGNLHASTIKQRIGAVGRGGVNEVLSGQIDELIAWTSAINAVEMEAAYAEGLRGNPVEKEMQNQAFPVASHRYSFDDANYSDPTLSDSIGSIDMTNVVVTGPPTKAVSGVAGQINQAFDFQGAQLLQSGSNSYNLGTEFAIGAWINRSGGGTILNKWDTTPNIPLQEFRLYISSNKLAFDYHTTATDTWAEVGFDTITSVNDVPSGEWVHVMVTRKDGDLRLYINGALEAVKDMGTDPLVDVGYPLSIGGETATGSGFFTGQIDEVQIWKKHMEERQVKLVYTTEDGGTAATSTDSITIAEYSSSVVGINPVRISIGNCKDTNILIQDSGTAAPLAGAISTPCVEGVAGHNSSALPATSDTVDVYFGDGASTVDGPYPVNVIYTP